MNLITVEGTITAGFGVIAYNLWSLANMWPPGCQAVMDLVLKNKAVKDTFGEPVTVGWQWDGELLPDSVAVHIPIVGPKATGVVFGRAVKAEGRWIVLVCEVKVDGQPTLPVKADDIANKK